MAYSPWLELRLNNWADLSLDLNPCLMQYPPPNQLPVFVCLELSGLQLICFDHQSCLLMPAKFHLTDIMQAVPQLCLLVVLEYPEVPSALCLEHLGALTLLRDSPLLYQSKWDNWKNSIKRLFTWVCTA